MAVYETVSQLLVRYFINTDMYIAIWDKVTNKTLNFDYAKINADNFGGSFPYPISIVDGKTYIGEIRLSQINPNKQVDSDLQEIIRGTDTEDNPVLVFYSIEL